MQSITLTIPPTINVFSDDELYAFCLANAELCIERDKNGQYHHHTAHRLRKQFYE